MIKKIDHIAIAVRDLDKALSTYRDKLGFKVKKIETFDALKVKIAFLPVGDVLIELLEPMDSSASIARFIQKNGEGLYHIAYRVDNIEEAVAGLKEKGMKFRTDAPMPGGGGARIIFLEPSSTNNVITELVERKEEI